MRILCFVFLLLLPIWLSAQVPTENVLSGTFNVIVAVPGGSSDFQVTGVFNDVTNEYLAGDVAAGMILWDLQGARFEIMAVSGVGTLTLDVRDINSQGFVNTGIGAVIDETSGYPVFVAGVSDNLNSRMDNHFKQVVDVSGSGSDNTDFEVVSDSLRVTDGAGSLSVALDEINFQWEEQVFDSFTGSTLAITVATLPTSAEEVFVWRNGILQSNGVGHDYFISGNNILLNRTSMGDRFVVRFRVSN